MNADHACALIERPTGDEGLDAVRWYVECPTCGPVGAPQMYEGDAIAIANRHEDAGE